MAAPRPTEPVEKSTPASVLGAGGIGLGPAQGAEVHHLLDRLAAQQVHGGVVDLVGTAGFTATRSPGRSTSK